jgi:tagatose-6-phosphate ketose/aldose isomerase
VSQLTNLLSLSTSEKQQRGLQFTPAEILQQPETWKETFRLFQAKVPQLEAFLRPLIKEGRVVYLVGAGSSDYVGRSLALLLRTHWRCEVSAVASTDLLTNREDLIFPEKKYLWVSFSRSGDSPEAVAVLEQALALCPNVSHLVITCNRQAQMFKLACAGEDRCLGVVLDDAVNDRGLAMTSSFTNMVVFGQALAHLWKPDVYVSTLDKMCEAAQFLLDRATPIAFQLATEGYGSACFIGAGALEAAARESALKLTELTGGAIRAFSETSLGLRHGPMSSLNLDTLFVIFMSQEERRHRYDSDLVAEIQRKQVVRTIVTIGGIHVDADESLWHPSFEAIGDAYRPAVDTIFAQILGLSCSIHEGLKPDSPSPEGVISRVVEKFQIYA